MLVASAVVETEGIVDCDESVAIRFVVIAVMLQLAGRIPSQTPEFPPWVHNAPFGFSVTKHCARKQRATEQTAEGQSLSFEHAVRTLVLVVLVVVVVVVVVVVGGSTVAAVTLVLAIVNAFVADSVAEVEPTETVVTGNGLAEVADIGLKVVCKAGCVPVGNVCINCVAEVDGAEEGIVDSKRVRHVVVQLTACI